MFVCVCVCVCVGGGGGGTGLLNKGGGSNRLPVEFPQVQASLYNNMLAHGTVTN